MNIAITQKLTPRLLCPLHPPGAVRQGILGTLPRSLVVPKRSQVPAQAQTVRTAFDLLFGQISGYQQLDERLARTLGKKESLLIVLSHPEILLRHNNPAELGARQRVRKRDASLQARTREGIGAWDTFQTLVSTATKLGVNVYQYFHDRITPNQWDAQLSSPHRRTCHSSTALSLLVTRHVS